jgi:hypothetical protein
MALKNGARSFAFHSSNLKVHFQILMSKIVGEIVERSVHCPSNQFFRIIRWHGSQFSFAEV